MHYFIIGPQLATMPRKKFKSFFEHILYLKSLDVDMKKFDIQPNVGLQLLPINERIEKILSMNKQARTIKPNQLYFMVFYDIENNKVRTRIAKYLLKKGCERIQKSVYMALLSRKTYLEMHSTLAEIQALYDNKDSIIFLPVATDQVGGIKLIGQNIDIALTFDNKTTLFI